TAGENERATIPGTAEERLTVYRPAPEQSRKQLQKTMANENRLRTHQPTLYQKPTASLDGSKNTKKDSKYVPKIREIAF
ncbi:hypothetical protein LTS03_009218, partial [Exophiala xenobiotica]